VAQGAEGAIGVLFDLDDPHPVAREISANGAGANRDYGPFATSGSYFRGGKIVKLAKGEIQPFEIVGVSTHAYVQWEIEATLHSHGRLRTVTIEDHGEPFRVTGSTPNERYDRYYEYRWSDARPHMYLGAQPPV
jgi:hypothetical protein